MSKEEDRNSRYLIFAIGSRSNVLRLSTQKDAGGWKYHEKKLFIEMIGSNGGNIMRTLKHDDIVELRDFLGKLIEHNNEIREKKKND
ncbi:hypothetical protein LCGC14_1903950 [marine sediment metagenome]|uniref:Uncharacterized protein n=1 Tax=marine sediment metagenome TaxID=412755 RepID=A0A0F9FW20_9ZZZZ